MPREPVLLPVEPSVIQWLRESAGWTTGEVSGKLGLQEESYLRFERGEKKPTLRQITLLAKAFKRPMAAFLLPAPQQESALPQDFRKLPRDKREFGRKMRRVFRKARWLQETSKELMSNLNISLDSATRLYRLSDNPSNAASRERAASPITLEMQMKWKNSYAAFASWRGYIESKNIRVFQISMPVEEARGFSLADAKPHAIVVNSADDINARIFTLFHEYAHILLAKTSVCIPEFKQTADSGEIAMVERWCNKFAADFLLPQDTFEHFGNNIAISDVGRLSSKFKVSKYALIIRMRESGIVSSQQMNDFLNRAPQTSSGKKGGFGKGMTQLDKARQEKGDGYLTLVMENLDRGMINTKDALDYLSVRMKYLEKIRNREKGAKNA
jgi:Zn-dependent peptidase ImmA (M78 family)/DNA-binding XRE family transcriptional regulator